MILYRLSITNAVSPGSGDPFIVEFFRTQADAVRAMRASAEIHRVESRLAVEKMSIVNSTDAFVAFLNRSAHAPAGMAEDGLSARETVAGARGMVETKDRVGEARDRLDERSGVRTTARAGSPPAAAPSPAGPDPVSAADDVVEFALTRTSVELLSHGLPTPPGERAVKILAGARWLPDRKIGRSSVFAASFEDFVKIVRHAKTIVGLLRDDGDKRAAALAKNLTDLRKILKRESRLRRNV